MNYEVVFHPDVARRLSHLTEAPRATVTAAIDDLARDANSTGSEVVRTWVQGERGTRFSVQLSYDHESRAMHVLSLRAEHSPSQDA